MTRESIPTNASRSMVDRPSKATALRRCSRSARASTRLSRTASRERIGQRLRRKPGSSGIVCRPRDFVDERPRDVVLAQLARVPGPAAGRHGLHQLAHHVRRARERFRAGDRDEATGILRFSVSEVMLAPGACHCRDRPVRPLRLHACYATRRAPRQMKPPQWRVRDRAGSSGTHARRISMPRASERRSVRRAPHLLVHQLRCARRLHRRRNGVRAHDGPPRSGTRRDNRPVRAAIRR